jgi:hypothetical protein
MWYCAEMRSFPAGVASPAGNCLKCQLQMIENTVVLLRGFFHKEILDSTAHAK